MRTVLAFLLLALLPAGARAQEEREAPAPVRRLLDRWQQDQQAARDGLARLTMTEEATRMLDGPFGIRRARIVTRVEGQFGRDRDQTRWNREVLSVSVNGEKIEPKALEERDRRRHKILGPELDAIARETFLSPRRIAGMKPVGAAREEEVRGRRTLRIVLVPAGESDRIERVTLWITPDRAELLRSHAIFNLRETTQMVITTDYVRRKGLDLPQQRRAEGTSQHQRRMRTFTMLIQMDARYSDFKLEKR